MATVESWTGTIADMGPLYPWASESGGTEVVLWLIGLALWLAWHVWQTKHETSTHEEEAKRFGGKPTEEKPMV